MVNINFQQGGMINVTGHFRAQIDNGFHDIFQIQTPVPMSEDQVVNFCFNNFLQMAVPESTEWHEQIKEGNPHWEDWCYYNNGFYKIEQKRNNIWEFTYVAPDLIPEAWQNPEERHQT